MHHEQGIRSKYSDRKLKTTTPQISVGMPVYNGEPYIEEAIQSVLRQTNPDFELIISDNASTDRTEQICRDYASQDRRIIYTRNQENLGAANNYNRVFQLSSAQYFRWFNADDLIAPTLHEKCAEVLNSHQDVVLCYGKTSIIDGSGMLIEPYDDQLDLQQERVDERYLQFFKRVGLTNAIYGLMRRSAVATTSLMGNGTFPSADVNFMAELTLHGKFFEIPERLFYRRMHEQASSWDRTNPGRHRSFWTGNGRQYTLPMWRKQLAHLKGLRSSPIKIRTKWRLLRFHIGRMIWVRRRLLNELWTELRKRASRQF